MIDPYLDSTGVVKLEFDLFFPIINIVFQSPVYRIETEPFSRKFDLYLIERGVVRPQRAVRNIYGAIHARSTRASELSKDV